MTAPVPALFSDDGSDPLPVTPPRLGPWYVCVVLGVCQMFRDGADVATIMAWTGDTEAEVLRRLHWHWLAGRVTRKGDQWLAK